MITYEENILFWSFLDILKNIPLLTQLSLEVSLLMDFSIMALP